MTKILSIAWYKILPARFGGQKGIARFNTALSKHFQVVCLCSNNNEPTGDEGYQVLPLLPKTKWQFLNPFTWRLVRNTVTREKPTHIILEHPYHGLAVIRAIKNKSVSLIVHSHNIESERFRELGKWWWKILRYYEGSVHRKADLNLFKTKKDMDWAIKIYRLAPGKCMVVPYGIDKKSASPVLINHNSLRQHYQMLPGEKMLLFAGTLDYEPNRIAVKNIYKKIVPLLDQHSFQYKIFICGKGMNLFSDSEFTHPRIIKVGETDNLDEWMISADAFINPVLIGGGIQTKNIDAIAGNCNLVCFENMIEPETKSLAPNKVFTAPEGNWTIFCNQLKAATVSKIQTGQSFFDKYNWENIVATVASRIETS